MEQGGTLELRLENKGQDYVILSVIDTGYGIKKEIWLVLQKLFIQQNKIKLVWDLR